jgi:lysophospholipase L1-like esterase
MAAPLESIPNPVACRAQRLSNVLRIFTSAPWRCRFLGCILLAYSLNVPLLAATPDPAEYLRPIAAELKKQWPTNRIINVVCHGHSVPTGYFKTPVVDSLNAYPHLLHRALKESYPFGVINVIVTAVGGEHSIRGAARFERDVLTHHPDVVCIDYALNDRRAGLEPARKAWEQMIQKAKAANVKVLLLTPTPDMAAKLEDPKDPLNQHAQQARSLASEYEVGLVDSLALFKAEVTRGTPLSDLMSQGNHPNRRGHALVATALHRWFVPDTTR